jgi:hypothetical protein
VTEHTPAPLPKFSCVFLKIFSFSIARHSILFTAIIERYRRRESSVEEALIEIYLAGVSVRRVEDITGTRIY